MKKFISLCLALLFCASMTTYVSANQSYPLTVYEHPSYYGHTQGFGVGSYWIGDLRAIGDNTISSLKVNSGYHVYLYEHSGFLGRMLYSESNLDFLGYYNDMTSSIVVEHIASLKAPIIYEHPGFRGSAQMLSPGLYNQRDLGLVDNTLSSIQVPPNYRVILFEHPNYSGTYITLHGRSNANITNQRFDNKTSSIYVEKLY